MYFSVKSPKVIQQVMAHHVPLGCLVPANLLLSIPPLTLVVASLFAFGGRGFRPALAPRLAEAAALIALAAAAAAALTLFATGAQTSAILGYRDTVSQFGSIS